MTTKRPSTKHPDISLVIPLKNEERTVRDVTIEAARVFEDQRDLDWEILLVSDASTDGTDELIAALSSGDPRIRGLRLHRSQGQSAALAAGFRRARAPLLAMMDGDGQNDPGDLPVLLDKMEELGVDMMCGIRTRRADNSLRRSISKFANRVRSAALGDGITDVGCSIRVFRRHAALQVPLFRNFHRFFPALFIMAGYKVAEMPVNHRERLSGKSKYGAGIRKRMVVVVTDLFGVMWLRRRAISTRVTKIRRRE